MALSSDTTLTRRAGEDFSYAQKAATKIYRGAMVALDANGYAVPAKTATGLTAVGLAQAGSDNSAGADGAMTVLVSRGCFYIKASDITRAHIGDQAYFVDDARVSSSSSSNSRSEAGRIVDVGDGGAWIEFV